MCLVVGSVVRLSLFRFFFFAVHILDKFLVLRKASTCLEPRTQELVHLHGLLTADAGCLAANRCLGLLASRGLKALVSLLGLLHLEVVALVVCGFFDLSVLHLFVFLNICWLALFQWRYINCFTFAFAGLFLLERAFLVLVWREILGAFLAFRILHFFVFWNCAGLAVVNLFVVLRRTANDFIHEVVVVTGGFAWGLHFGVGRSAKGMAHGFLGLARLRKVLLGGIGLFLRLIGPGFIVVARHFVIALGGTLWLLPLLVLVMEVLFLWIEDGLVVAHVVLAERQTVRVGGAAVVLLAKRIENAFWVLVELVARMLVLHALWVADQLVFN